MGADAVVVPGGRYGPTAPLLMYTGDVAERRGATVHRHSWSSPQPSPSKPETESWVCGEVAPVLDSIGGDPTGGGQLLIGKSLGTYAATVAAGRSLPAMWLTPVLNRPWVVEALGRATAPFLLVGGTADPLWDGALARKLSPHVLEVAGADHGMYVPGPLTDSIDVLRRVVATAEEFLDTIGWPH